jgi:germination protein M
MIKGKKRYVFGGLALCLLTAAVIVTVVTMRRDTGVFRLPVYYYNPTVFMLETREHNLPAGDEHVWLDAAVAQFGVTSRIPAITGVWPYGEGFLTHWKMNGNIMEAVFPAAYHDIPPLEEALYRAAFVWTMTGLPFVNMVKISVEGDDPEITPALLESRATVAINPAISPIRLRTRTITLYFINETHDALVPVTRISHTVDMDQEERYYIELLIAGPDEEELVGFIPPETRVIDITIDEGTCYVNLSSDFISRFNGSTATARLVVHSIVNTLTRNITYIRRVMFLIDSEKVDQFQGITDFHQTYEWDETLILGYIPPSPPVLPEDKE